MFEFDFTTLDHLNSKYLTLIFDSSQTETGEATIFCIHIELTEPILEIDFEEWNIIINDVLSYEDELEHLFGNDLPFSVAIKYYTPLNSL